MRGAPGGHKRSFLGTFGGVRRLGIAAAAATAALATAPAVAQNPTTVSAKTPEGRTVTLTVRDSGGSRCQSITFADEAARRTSACAPPAKDGHDDARAVHAVYRVAPERITILYGSVSGATRELKIRLGDGRLEAIRPDRDSGAFLRVISGRPAVATVNAHDAKDALIGAADVDPRAVEPRRGPFALFRTRDERGQRVTVTAFTARIFRDRSTSRPLQACMGIGRRGSAPTSNIEPGYAGGSACTTSRRRVIVRYAAGCSAKRLILYGIVPTAVARLQLLTAAGARLPVQMERFPRALRHSGRAFVYSAPNPGQVTRLEAFARSGDRLASLALGGVGSGCGSSRRS
jgi:hypothetical protein